MKDLLNLDPIQAFLKTTGEGIKKYFGSDDGCIVYLRPDGTFYGTALHQWLSKKRKNLLLTSMEDDGQDLDESKVKNRKVLIVDNDIVTGKGYKRAMEAMRLKKKRLNIKDVKFAAFSDRVGLADFSVDKYSAEAVWRLSELDALDLKIIQHLSQNGREALADIGKKVHLSSVAVKNRLDKLLKEKVIRIEARLNLDQFFTMSAQVYVEGDRKTIDALIEKFEKHQEVYALVRVTGIYNLFVGITTHNWQSVEEFIESEIRVLPGVKKIFITTGDIPILPKTIPPQF